MLKRDIVSALECDSYGERYNFRYMNKLRKYYYLLKTKGLYGSKKNIKIFKNDVDKR